MAQSEARLGTEGRGKPQGSGTRGMSPAKGTHGGFRAKRREEASSLVVCLTFQSFSIPGDQ